MVFRSSTPVGAAAPSIFVLEGWKERGIKQRKPPVSSWSRPESSHVLDSLPVGFDVSVEHRGVGFDTELVGFPVHPEPFLAADLGRAQGFPDARAENLRPTARKHVEPGGAKPREHLPGRCPFPFGKMSDFDRRESPDEDARAGNVLLPQGPIHRRTGADRGGSRPRCGSR